MTFPRTERQLVVDRLMAELRKPTAGPMVTPEECISAALSLFVPGPADLISPDGRGVRLILLTLDKMNFKIVPKARDDFPPAT
jgi:hypothetical protein